jgi:hypothetical protein
MPNDDMSLRADIEDIERRLKLAKKEGNLMIVDMLEDRLANRKRQLEEIEAKRRRYRTT